MKIKVILSIVLGLTSFIGAFAQFTVRVGDVVEARRGSEWVEGKVESIEGSIIKVRFGTGKYDFQNYQSPTTAIRAKGSAAREEQENKMHWAFRAETADKYYLTVSQFAPSYNDQFISAGSPTTAAGWQKAMNDLAGLDAICKSKYPGITDSLIYLREGIIDYRYAQWCDIAAKRLTLEPKARASAAAHMASVPGADDLKRALEYEDNRVVDDIQLLMYEPDKWKAQNSAKMKPHFATYGVQMPANFFDDMLRKAAELKAEIDAGAPLREFETSATRDAAVESFIKGKFITEYPGSQILKSRVDYPNWVKRESLSLVGSGTGYKLYKVEYNFYKRGWVLMKMPNRPYCQAREWIVGRGAKGLVAVSTSSQGTFMKCQ